MPASGPGPGPAGGPGTGPGPGPAPAGRRGAVPALWAAGFTTAFGAHAIAAGFGAESGGLGISFAMLGLLLALYDVSEVVLKPVFGSLSDRIGVKPVIVGGLALFAAASALGSVWGTTVGLAVARLAQGAAASAFSPASSAGVARLSDKGSLGRAFGSYGSWKGLGYALGPVLGAGLIALGGLPALFAALTVLSLAVLVWVLLALPALPPTPRPRSTARDLVRELTRPGFLQPTASLAVTTGTLGVAVGFLPRVGRDLGLGTGTAMLAVTALAVASSLSQPWVGRRHDAGRLSGRAGTAAGLVAIAAGVLLLALVPHVLAVFGAAALIGVGIGTVTPLAFARLAGTAPEGALGRTLGSAEVGRELGDAGGPLLVGLLATVAGLPVALSALAGVVVVQAAGAALTDGYRPHKP